MQDWTKNKLSRVDIEGKKKLRIGIMTFHASHNCGSMLQTYALLNIIKSRYDCDVEIIDFSNNKQKKMYSIFYKITGFHSLNDNFLRLTNYKNIKKYFNDYNEFIDNNMNLSVEKYSENSQLIELEKTYDMIICGSDQIWNIKAGDFDDAYFLPQKSKVVKVAYAPSFGGINPSEYISNIDRYQTYLNDFDMISVRETSGQEYLKNIVGKTYPILLDPTLLAELEMWDKLDKVSVPHKQFIFYYSYAYNSEKINKFVEKAAKYFNLPVYVINARMYSNYHLKKYNFILIEKGGPLSYISYIKNAKYVFVESFHGMIFSTIFKKNFWALRDNSEQLDDRLKCLSEQLNIFERVINVDKIGFEELKEFKESDKWFYDNEELNKLKDKSFNYLDDAFKICLERHKTN